MWLISLIVAAFLIQLVVSAPWFGPGIYLSHHFGVSVGAIQELRLWTIFTHPILHRTDNFLHIIAVVGGLVLLGREMLPVMGARRFIGLYFAACAVGALVWSAVNWRAGGSLVGGIAGVYGLFVLFACLNPKFELRFMLFFFMPITLRPRTVACVLAAFDLGGCAYYELGSAVAPFAYAPSAHLGGMAAGLACYAYFYSERSLFSARSALPAAASAKTEPGSPGDFAPASSEDLRAEVDRILDKINASGLGSLTAVEKRLLDEARNLSPRN